MDLSLRQTTNDYDGGDDDDYNGMLIKSFTGFKGVW